MGGICAGVNVIEMGAGSIAASVTGMVLADAGARVIKVETKLMSRDLAPRIRVNAVAPGSTRTPSLERYYTAADLEAKIARIPCDALGRPKTSRWLCCSSPRLPPAT
jgi:NAD(P)-dependent dehydrogenase (short-subunit alcohol dehydrogenase family)